MVGSFRNFDFMNRGWG